MKRLLIIVAILAGFALVGLNSVRADACDVCFTQGEQVYAACVNQGGSSDDCRAQKNAVLCVCAVQNGCGDWIIIACGQ